jgi:hypothetical protein
MNASPKKGQAMTPEFELAIGFDLDAFASLHMLDFQRRLIKLSWRETLRRVRAGSLSDAIFMRWPRWKLESDQEFRDRIRILIREGTLNVEG